MPVGQEVTAIIFFIQSGSGIIGSCGWTSDHGTRDASGETRCETEMRIKLGEVGAVQVAGPHLEGRDELTLWCVGRDIHPELRGIGRFSVAQAIAQQKIAEVKRAVPPRTVFCEADYF